MQNMRQSQITEHNKTHVMRAMYPVIQEGRESLIDITQETNDVIAIDCCGWHYSQVFQKKLIMLETLLNAKYFKLGLEYFTKLIDDRDNTLLWPNIPNISNPVVLLDRSNILRYRTMTELKSIIQNIVTCYTPSKIIIRGRLEFLDDSRLGDRLHTWFDFFPIDNYITVKFLYDTTTMIYSVDLKRLS